MMPAHPRIHLLMYDFVGDRKYAHSKNAHIKNTGKMPTRKNTHMYNSFKTVTGMSAFVKK